MLRLSQKAWNNVVIFAMLFMVYLFTLSNDMINKGDEIPEAESVFPAFSVVMTLDFGVSRIDRIGQDWRLTSDDEISLQRLVAISETWSTLSVLPTTLTFDSAPYVVSIQLAGENRSRVYQLFPQGGDIILQLNGAQYLLSDINIDQLFPVEQL